MGADSPGESFIDELSRVLHHLYDPNVLHDSALLPAFGLQHQADAVTVLQRILTDAVEALQPQDSAPPGSQAWRLYYILYYRFTEQMLQREVAAELGLSIRQLRRQEKMALHVLGDHLAASYDLEHQARPAEQTQLDGASVASRTPSRERELDWLERTIPSEAVDVGEWIAAALNTARPLLETLSISLHCTVPEKLPPLTVQRTTARQALLHVITMAARAIPGGRLDLAARSFACPPCVRVVVTALGEPPSIPGDSPSISGDSPSIPGEPPSIPGGPPSVLGGSSSAVDGQEGASQVDAGRAGSGPIEMAEELLRMSGGSLSVMQGDDAQRPFVASIIVPTIERLPVLVVDDNVDTLRLMQRYLSGSRYQFYGTANPQDVLAMAGQVQPQIVVLDVMLPGIDGWELLGRLREHPKMRDRPVIVCSILPQDQLARTLGAAGYLPKPISQRELLSALDRQVAQLVQKAHSTS